MNLLVAADWEVVNDDATAGVAKVTLSDSPRGLRFAGEVRADLDGGHAAVRRPFTTQDWQAGGPVRGVVLRVRGDGHRYRCTIFTRDPRTGARQPHLYSAVFATQWDHELTVSLPFNRFEASFRGRPIAAPPLVAADIVGLGLMLTKEGHLSGRGPFALDLLALTPLRA